MLDCASKCQLKYETDGNCNAFKFSDNSGSCQLAKVIEELLVDDEIASQYPEGDIPGGPGCR